MTSIEFRGWPKTPRLFRGMVVTEKVDGTNAGIIIQPGNVSDSQDGWCGLGEVDGAIVKVGAQSRKRIITPGADNYAFAAWVRKNCQALAETLGVGYHYGEWWGHGIQRGYGLPNGEHRLSLFNTARYRDADLSTVPGLGVVPVLLERDFSTAHVRATLLTLMRTGSVAAPGFMRPEGVIVYHSGAGTIYKALIENDDLPKGVVGSEACH